MRRIRNDRKTERERKNEKKEKRRTARRALNRRKIERRSRRQRIVEVGGIDGWKTLRGIGRKRSGCWQAEGDEYDSGAAA